MISSLSTYQAPKKKAASAKKKFTKKTSTKKKNATIKKPLPKGPPKKHLPRNKLLETLLDYALAAYNTIHLSEAPLEDERISCTWPASNQTTGLYNIRPEKQRLIHSLTSHSHNTPTYSMHFKLVVYSCQKIIFRNI